MTKIHTSIKFNDQKCREAMNFYKDILGGELEFMTGKGTPMESEMPADKIDNIMHSTLTNGAWTIVGSDMMRDKATIGDNVGIFIECDSEEDITRIFTSLSEGGEVFMPLEDMFWGARFGSVTDKYGVEWMLNFQKDK